VRNHHMAAVMGTFAIAQNARIAVQQCGNNHIARKKRRGRLGRHSLAACFKENNMPVLAMPIFNRDFDESDIPEDHRLQDDEKLFRTGVPAKRAIYHPLLNISLDKSADFKSRRAEAAWVNALLERVGLKSERMTVKEYREQLESLEADVIEKFERWDKEFSAFRAGNNSNSPTPTPQS